MIDVLMSRQIDSPSSAHHPTGIPKIAKQKLLLLKERNLPPRLSCLPPETRFRRILINSMFDAKV